MNKALFAILIIVSIATSMVSTPVVENTLHVYISPDALTISRGGEQLSLRIWSFDQCPGAIDVESRYGNVFEVLHLLPIGNGEYIYSLNSSLTTYPVEGICK